jgi:hypothetical protein
MCSAYTAVPERVTTPTRRGVATTDDDAVGPHPAGGGTLAATRPPARRTAVRADRTARRRRGVGQGGGALR